jgi:hypothetical protein
VAELCLIVRNGQRTRNGAADQTIIHRVNGLSVFHRDLPLLRTGPKGTPRQCIDILTPDDCGFIESNITFQICPGHEPNFVEMGLRKASF